MESDNFYGDFMVKSIWKLSGNLFHHISSMKPLDNLQINLTKFYQSITLNTDYIPSPYYGGNTDFQ